MIAHRLGNKTKPFNTVQSALTLAIYSIVFIIRSDALREIALFYRILVLLVHDHTVYRNAGLNFLSKS